MSRIRLICVALLWMVSVALAPGAWMGCKFRVDSVILSERQIEVKLAVDPECISKVTIAYAKVSGDQQGEIKYDRPSMGWDTFVYYYPIKYSTDYLLVSVAGYDDNGHLLCFGRAESVNGSDVTIKVHSKIPWPA